MVKALIPTILKIRIKKHRTQKIAQNDTQQINFCVALEPCAEMTGCEVLHGDLVADNGVTR